MRSDMISNNVTTNQDLADFEKKLLETNFSATNWDETNHAMNELVRKLHSLSEGDKYHEHYVQIKHIVGEIKKLDVKAKKVSQIGMEKGIHLFENLLYDRDRVLEDIEYAANQEIGKHVDFIVGEVVHEHTVEKNLFTSVRQYLDLASLPESELNTVVFDTYIQKVADEALQHDYDHATFDLLKSAILMKVQELMKIHFTNEKDKSCFENYLSQVNDRQWDNIIKTALL